MVVVTCISDENNIGFNSALLPSCEFYNIKLKVLLHNEKWDSHRIKDKYLLDYLKNVNENEVIIFVDGYDSIITSSEDEILSKFNKLNSNFIFSAEVNCYPCHELQNRYKSTSSIFRFLNSGGFIGRAGYIVSILKEVEEKEDFFRCEFDNYYKWSNQYWWTKIYLSSYFDIILDSECQIFQTFSSDVNLLKFISENNDKLPKDRINKVVLKELKNIFKNFSTVGHSLLNNRTNSMPSILHFNNPLIKQFYLMGIFKELLPWQN